MCGFVLKLCGTEGNRRRDPGREAEFMVASTYHIPIMDRHSEWPKAQPQNCKFTAHNLIQACLSHHSSPSSPYCQIFLVFNGFFMSFPLSPTPSPISFFSLLCSHPHIFPWHAWWFDIEGQCQTTRPVFPLGPFCSPLFLFLAFSHSISHSLLTIV